jgi:hypothetical protein
MRVETWATPSAIVLGAVLITVSVLGASFGARFVDRYEISASVDADGNSVVWRINTRTGNVEYCRFENNSFGEVPVLRCSSKLTPRRDASEQSVGPPKGPDRRDANPFAHPGIYFLPPEVDPLASVVHRAAQNLIPAAAAFGGAWAGAEAGGVLGVFGGPAAPVTVPLGVAAGGLFGFFGGSWLAEKAQHLVGQSTPYMFKDELGLSDTDERLDKAINPNASTVGALLPYSLAVLMLGWILHRRLANLRKQAKLKMDEALQK